MAQTSIDRALLVYKPWLLLVRSMKIHADWRWWHDAQAISLAGAESTWHSVTTLETAGSNLGADGVSRDLLDHVGSMVSLYYSWQWSTHLCETSPLWSLCLVLSHVRWADGYPVILKAHDANDGKSPTIYGETGGWLTPGSTMLILMVDNDQWWLMMFPGEVLAASAGWGPNQEGLPACGSKEPAADLPSADGFDGPKQKSTSGSAGSDGMGTPNVPPKPPGNWVNTMGTCPNLVSYWSSGNEEQPTVHEIRLQTITRFYMCGWRSVNVLVVAGQCRNSMVDKRNVVGNLKTCIVQLECNLNTTAKWSSAVCVMFQFEPSHAGTTAGDREA